MNITNFREGLSRTIRQARQYTNFVESTLQETAKSLSKHRQFIENLNKHPLFNDEEIKQFMDKILPAIEMLMEIDFDNIEEEAQEGFVKIDQSLEIYDNYLWAVDDDLYFALEEGSCTLETMGSYIEENIDTYLQFFLENEYYKNYHSLLEQAIYAFKQEQYIIAAMPLFTVIEGNIVSAFEEYVIDDSKLKPFFRKNKEKIKIYAKVKDYVETEKDKLAYFFIFLKRIFKVYSTLFQPSRDKYPEEINRNYIMHGSYKYDEITKEDVLKLIQLVKATSILQYITFE